MNSVKTLGHLSAKPLERIIDELLNSDRRNEGGNPLVTLHLHSGRDLTGYVLSATQDQDLTFILLHRAEAATFTDDASYVNANRVEAITIHNASRLVQTQLTPLPTRLDLKRQAMQLTQNLTQQLGHPFIVELEYPADSAPLRVMATFLEELPGLLRSFCQDELRSNAFNKIQKLNLSIAPTTEILRDGGCLMMTLAMEPPLSNSLILKKLEAIL